MRHRKSPKPSQTKALQHPSVNIPDFSLKDFVCDIEMWSSTLEDVLNLNPPEVVIEFIGMHTLNPDAALILHDVLQNKGAATEIVTVARSPVLDSGVLIWLMGNRRYIRPTAWMRFPGPRAHRRRSLHRFPWNEEAEPWLIQAEDECGREFVNPNYDTVLKLINQYLPVNLLADSLLTPHVLSEYNLLAQ